MWGSRSCVMFMGSPVLAGRLHVTCFVIPKFCWKVANLIDCRETTTTLARHVKASFGSTVIPGTLTDLVIAHKIRNMQQ